MRDIRWVVQSIFPKLYHGRNKTFWFTNYEKDHYNDFAVSGFATLPTPNFKKGDFLPALQSELHGKPAIRHADWHGCTRQAHHFRCDL